MKRLSCILISVCLLLCLTACGKEPQQPDPTENDAVTQTQPPTDGRDPDTETQVSEEEKPDAVRLLTLEKALHTYYEWADALPQALVRSEHSCVTLGQEDAALYPEMAQVLEQIAVMQERTMLDEFDNLVSTAQEQLAWGADGFETYVSTLDVQVRRADSLVISLLADTYSDYGQIRSFRSFHGSNYDTRTGRELMLNEVVDVNNYLALAVQKELTSHMWTGEFHSEYAVEEYFADTPVDGFSWTLDYTGVTFYFAPGELCDGGAMTATVSFAEYPELFNAEYMAVPEAYTVELPMHLSFFTELDGDGVLEEISFSALREEERDHYVSYSIHTDTDAQHYDAECYVYDFHPYYVKAADGHFLYLFCEDFDAGERQMRLVVLGLNEDGSVAKSGEWNLSPAWLADNRFIVPTDPGCLILDDADNGSAMAVFEAGPAGIQSRP